MIPLVNLRAQYASIKDEIDTAVLRVLASGRFSLGPEVAGFNYRMDGMQGAILRVKFSTRTDYVVCTFPVTAPNRSSRPPRAPCSGDAR